MPRPTIWQRTLDSSKRQALLAVKLYNDPSDVLALDAFVVHMHIAWLYLYQAKFVKERREFRVRDLRFKGLRYERVDGEYRTQPLSWFVQNDLPEDPVLRKNLEFFIMLRNKIEHRHEETTRALADAISGESHALLLNYEEALVAVGGESNSLATQLKFPVFLGGFTERGKAELLKQSKSLPEEYKTFIAEYYTALDDEVLLDPRFSLRLTLVLEKANRSGDWSMTFVNPNDLDEDEKRELEARLKQGALITREKYVSIANQGLLKPKQAQLLVEAQIPFAFNSYDFQQAYKRKGCRPPSGTSDPMATMKDFCVYDEPNHSYLYTPAWVHYLARKCSTADGFEAITGRAPRLK